MQTQIEREKKLDFKDYSPFMVHMLKYFFNLLVKLLEIDIKKKFDNLLGFFNDIIMKIYSS